MADLRFIFFGFGCFAFVEIATVLLVWSNPNQSNRTAVGTVILRPPMASVLCKFITFYTGKTDKRASLNYASST